MSDVMMKRLELLEHVDAIATYIAENTMLTAAQAYNAVMDCVNKLVDDNQPMPDENGEKED